MKIVNTIKEVREQVKEWKKQGLSVGLVPTMGYLHEGHQSLMEAARKNNDRVVVSIFVNPMQFGRQCAADRKRYRYWREIPTTGR